MSADFLITSLVVVLIPGTGVVFTLATAIGGGLSRGLIAAVGCTLGIVPHLLAAMLGLSGVMQAGSAAFELVRFAGIAYLLYIGISMIRAGDDLLGGERGSDAGTAGQVIRRGVLLNLLNPKLTLFFFAFLPQFLDRSPGVLDAHLIALGAVFMAMTLAVFAVYAYLGAALRERVLGAPSVRLWIQRSLGAVLVAFAARLAVGDR